MRREDGSCILSCAFADDLGVVGRIVGPHISPIKALLNNQEHRLARYFQLVGRQATCWHGDTPQGRTQDCRRTAGLPSSTPESLEAILVSVRLTTPDSSRNVRTVVIDELHAFAADDRGWHLLSVFARIQRLLAGTFNASACQPRRQSRRHAGVAGVRLSPARQIVCPRHPRSVHQRCNSTSSDRCRTPPRSFACCTRARSDWFSATAALGWNSCAALAGHGSTRSSAQSLSVEERRSAEQAFASRQNCVSLPQVPWNWPRCRRPRRVIPCPRKSSANCSTRERCRRKPVASRPGAAGE